PRRIVRITSRRTETVRARQHPEGAVVGCGVVEEDDRGHDVGRVLADRDVPIRIVLVPRELAPLAGALQVELGRERSQLVAAELAADGLAQSVVTEERL